MPVEEMASIIFPSNIDDMNKLFKDLKSGKDFKPLSHKYNQIADHFTGVERLRTKGRKGISFFEFCEKIKNGEVDYPSVHRCIETYPKQSRLHALKYAFNLYYGYIGNFAMWNAMNFFKTYKPTRVLDPTAGFGNRMIAACASGVETYTGIDSNKELTKPYEGLAGFLGQHSNTLVKVVISNALDVDYTNILYDCVFTSLPYYTLEDYSHMHDYGTKQQWNDDFYKPLIRKTWEGLAPGGVYALNVPDTIYDSCCVPIIGQCVERVGLVKKQRKEGKGGDYGEFIYVWRKPLTH